MRVVVTGASGFLGGALVERFRAEGWEVHALRWRPGSRDKGLRTVESWLAQIGPDAVVNAGASQNGRDDPGALEELVLSNVLMPAQLASRIRDLCPGCSLIHFGTSWQIGEDGRYEPFNAYAASKEAAERMLEHFAMDGVRVASLRLYDTYGPGDRRKKVVNLIADALLRGEELEMSDGEQVIDLVHIRDVTEAVIRTLALLRAAPPGKLRRYAVRSGRTVTVRALAGILEAMIGPRGGRVRLGVLPYRRRERFALYPDLAVPPGWQPQVVLEEGLREVVEWRERHLLQGP